MAAMAPLQEQICRMTPVSASQDTLPQLAQIAVQLARIVGVPTVKANVPAQTRLVGPSGEQIPLPEPMFHLLAPSGEQIPLPEPMFHLVARMAEVLARGDAVTIVPVGRELTTQQAADLLNVSRQYLVRLLDENELPFTRTEGKHRRLRIEDVLSYRAKRDHEREAGLDELAATTQDLGGYPELNVK